MSERHSVNKVVLIIHVCIRWVLCKIVILVHGHEQDYVHLPLDDHPYST